MQLRKAPMGCQTKRNLQMKRVLKMTKLNYQRGEDIAEKDVPKTTADRDLKLPGKCTVLVCWTSGQQFIL